MHYYKPNDNLELEFIIEKNEEVIPIEVKAGNTSTKSLDSFINEFEPSIGVKIINGNIGQIAKKFSIFHYLAMCV